MSKDVSVFEGNLKRDSSVGIGTGYMLDGHETEVWFGVAVRRFSLLHSGLASSEAPSNLLLGEHGKVFLRSKTAGA
jgi:hypothetical protein